MFIHLVCRTHNGLQPFRLFDTCQFTWTCLRRGFPDALAAVLMPNHLHLVTPTEDPDASRLTLARIAGAISTHIQRKAVFQPVPPPDIIRPGLKLQRQVRYVHLNPCRKHLVDDPLKWLWSTHLDVVGGTVDPWVTADRIEQTLGMWPDRFHQYVAGDPSCSPSASAFPAPHRQDGTPRLHLEALGAAACVAMRAPGWDLHRRTPTRRLFIALAWHEGWRDVQTLMRATGASRTTVYRAAKEPPEGLEAARLIAGDERLVRLFHGLRESALRRPSGLLGGFRDQALQRGRCKR